MIQTPSVGMIDKTFKRFSMFKRAILLVTVFGFQLVETSQPLKRLASRKSSAQSIMRRNFSHKAQNDKLVDFEKAGILVGGLTGALAGSMIGGGAVLVAASNVWQKDPVLADSDEAQARMKIVKFGASIGATTGSYATMKHILRLRPKAYKTGAVCIAAISTLGFLIKK